MTGAAAGIYAASLAGVTALQASTDAGLAAERQPLAAAIGEQRALHDGLDTALAQAADGYGEAAAAYAAILEALGAHEADLAALREAVAAAEGSAAGLTAPARRALPTIPSSVGVAPAPRPPTNATSGASGGG
jgi:hypothetical protein